MGQDHLPAHLIQENLDHRKVQLQFPIAAAYQEKNSSLSFFRYFQDQPALIALSARQKRADQEYGIVLLDFLLPSYQDK